MSKGKKEGNHHEKYDRAEQKSHFFEKIKWICSASGRPDAYQMIPRGELETLYRLRSLPFRIMAAPGQQVQEDVLKRMRSVLSYSLKNRNVPLLKNGPEVTLVEYHSVVEMFRLYLSRIEDSAFRTAAELKNAMSPFAQFEEGNKIGSDQILVALNVAASVVSDLNSRLYWVERKEKLRSFDPFGYESLLLVHSGVPEKKYFSMDGISRPSVKVCWPFQSKDGIYETHVNPDALGIQSRCSSGALDVYIQAHALRRLSERLDSIGPASLQMELYFSLEYAHGFRQDNGSFLIEYMYHRIKVGYLVADLQDNALVIRTFLFITNSGTPEGKKLHEISGIRRLDKEFLAIDKLSTFIASDIRSNKELESLFLEAGCGCLLELHDREKDDYEDEGMTSSLTMLMKYFGLGEKEDFLAPDPIAKLRAKFAVDS